MIKRPLKAPGEPITDFQLKDLDYPVYGSPKLDGIRALCTGTQVLSATLKPIGNQYIQSCLNHRWYEGLDGELVVGVPYCENEEDDVFNRTTGAVRRRDGKPDFKFYVFDDFTNPNDSYQKRWIDQVASDPEMGELPYIEVLEQRLLNSSEEVLAYEAECVAQGYEGIMIRSPKTKYKEGRCTLKEESIFKRKPIEDDEATIISCYEQLENQNEQVTTELGTSKRSAHKENKVPKGTLGGFRMKSLKYGWEFNCGTIVGGTIEWRKYVWEHQDEFIGQIAKYKFQKYGSLDAPRQPRMKGLRDKSDMTDF